MKPIHAFGIFAAMIFMLGFGYGTIFQQQTAQATGCPVDTIVPMIDDAIKSLEANDAQTALGQLQDAKKELQDTFEVEE